MEFVINGRFLTQPITGVQRYAGELIQALDAILGAEPRYRITVLSPRLTKPAPVWHNIRLRQIGILHGHAWEQLELPWHSRGKLLFCPGNTAPLTSLLSAQPLVVTVHDLSYKYFPEAYRATFRLWYRLLIPLILRRATSVITVSQSERRAMIAHYPAAAHVHVIANGGLPKNAPIGTTNPANPHRGYILYVGSLSKRKNFPRLAELACRLARERGYRFVFVGDKSKSLATSGVEIPDDVKSLITFAGAVDDPAALFPFYRNAACFVFPSFYESSGLPPIEAMACGCPVIASDIPALRERCGDAAIYCDPHNADSIASALERVMADGDLRTRLRALGHQRAASYNWESCALQTLDVIRRSIDRARA